MSLSRSSFYVVSDLLNCYSIPYILADKIFYSSYVYGFALWSFAISASLLTIFI